MCTCYPNLFNIAKGSLKKLKSNFAKQCQNCLAVSFISCQKLYISNTLSLGRAKSANIEALKVRVGKGLIVFCSQPG